MAEMNNSKKELKLESDNSLIIPTEMIENLYGKNPNIGTFSIEITEDAETGNLGFAIFVATKKEV